MENEDYRQGGTLGGAYYSEEERKRAGVGMFDTMSTAQSKLISNRCDEQRKFLESLNSQPVSTMPKVPGILDDREVRKAIFKGIFWLTIGVAGFCMVYFGAPKLYDKVVYAMSPKNSKNWQYLAVDNFGLATLLSSKDGTDKLNSFKGNQAELEATYKNLYGSVFTNTQYQKIFSEGCQSATKCSDIGFSKLRDMAIKNNQLSAFDVKTAGALTNYWNTVDPSKKYNYQAQKAACDPEHFKCQGSVYYYSHNVYRNTLEEEK